MAKDNNILNNIHTENTWVDVDTVAALKGISKRAVRLSTDGSASFAPTQRVFWGLGQM